MIRSLDTFGPLGPAERRLVDGVGSGEMIAVGSGLPPDDAGPDRTIRAALVRYLLLGGCPQLPQPVSEAGVRLSGARIVGPLILRDVATDYFIDLTDCDFEHQLQLQFARIAGLYLKGCRFPGIEAPMLESRASVVLDGAHVTGKIRMPGGKIGGVLSCVAATFRPGGPVAMELHGLELRGSVILAGARAEGQVDLKSGKISGGVECSGAQFRAAGGNPVALSLDGAGIRNALVLDKGARVEGVLDLTAAHLRAICDEQASWPRQGDLILDQCVYGGFTGGDIGARARKTWLALQDPARWGKEFWPQPWEQCAKVLREMGLPADARAILIDKEKRQRAAIRARLSWPRRAWRWSTDMLVGATTRYGRRPLLAVLWLAAFWLIGAAVFHSVERAGAIKPSAVLTQRSPEWMACVPGYVQVSDAPAPRWQAGYRDQLDCFRAQPEAAGYPSFNAWVYSADTLLPIVDMEMQSYWVPNERLKPVGRAGRVYLWWQIAVGWALSLLTVAGISGVIKTDSS